MDPKEVRLRCIEAISGTGIREPHRITADAGVLEEWVLSAPDNEQKRSPGRPPKAQTADKD
jgi:hypothetical protein